MDYRPANPPGETRPRCVGFARGQARNCNGQFRRRHLPDGYGLAVQKLAVAGNRFEGMADGVAEIQNRPQAALPFVLRNDLRFDFAAARTVRPAQRGSVPAATPNPFPTGQTAPASRMIPLFDDLGQPGAELAQRQSGQRAQIAQHQARLIKRARQGFARRQIDPVFPPTELSTCASKVVGTCTKAIPRK